MAIYYADVRAFSRGKGHSSVAAAAYRIGAALRDDRTGTLHNYSRKAGVLGYQMHAPAQSPPWALNAAELWSQVERRETRVNACVARELIVALPSELPEAQRALLACSMAQWLVDRYGVAVMTALHAPDARGDQRNVHAHLLMTTRRMTATGLGAKTRELQDRKTGKVEVRAIREMVSVETNAALARHGLAIRIDHRTLRAQAIEAERRGDVGEAMRLARRPTRHEGRSVSSARRRGTIIGRARRNDEVIAANRVQHAQLHRTLSPTLGRSWSVRRGKPANAPARERVTAARADGRDRQLLNAQASALAQSLRVDAEAAHDYQQMLAQPTGAVPAVAAEPCCQARADSPLRHSTTAARTGAAQSEATSNHRKRSSPSAHTRRPSTRGLSRREWAEYRRSQHRMTSGAAAPAESAPPVASPTPRRRRSP